MWTDFLADEAGAVTVDWVVLTSALVGIGMATGGLVSNGVEAASHETSVALSAIDPSTDPFADEGGAFNWGDYDLLGSGHSQAWRDDMNDRFYPEMTDAQLDNWYGERQAEVAGRVAQYEHGIDHLGAAEAEYARRGLTPPDVDGYVSYEEARADFLASSS